LSPVRSTWGSGGGGGGGVSFTPFSLRSIPVTRALLIAVVACFLLDFFSRGVVVAWLAFGAFPPVWYARPWTWLTYPFAISDPMTALFQCYWLYIVGGSLERSWGWRNYLFLFFAFTLIGALLLVPVAYLFGATAVAATLLLTNSALTVAWAALDPDMEISLYGIIPLRIKYLALIDVVFVYFSYGFQFQRQTNLFPVAALLALAAPAAAWIYVRKLPRLNIGYRVPGRGRRPGPGRASRIEPLLREDPASRERVSGFDPLRKRREQQEIERLRRLLGEDDEPPVRH
jgi:membrane associated rhomboid family serine protease